MDTKSPSQASSSFNQNIPARPRRRPYLIIAVFLGLALIAYYVQPRTKDQEVSLLPYTEDLRPCDLNEPVRRVAIIGAGSAGTSAAYYLSKFARRCHHINLTIYERSSYIGGRSTTVNAFDSPSEPVELGASIFVKVNRNLVEAVKAFGLSTRGFKREEEEYDHDLGIYNGQGWVYLQNNDDSYWWNTAKLLWRYGIAPIRTRNLMKSTTGKFFKMYDAPYFPFKDLSQVVYDVGLTDVTAVSGETFLRQNNIGEKFGRELIQASTRVNYAQNLDTIHGLETMVCMATEGAMSVEGGNWQIFANMAIASKAVVKLETSVTGLTLLKDGTLSLEAEHHPSEGTSSLKETETAVVYDDVVLAAPFQYANLTITPRPSHPPPEIPYVNLHVTLFTSPHRLNPLAFKLPQTDHVPATILTTLPEPGIHGAATPPPLPFYSISTLRTVINPSTLEREYLYKIFSPAPLPHTYLTSLLDDSDGNQAAQKTTTYGPPFSFSFFSSPPHRSITWLYEKHWHSYPVESPRVTFEDLMIDLAEERGGGLGDEGVDPPPPSTAAAAAARQARRPLLWYTSGIEGFISTMETSSLMGRNVARLIVDGWLEGGMNK